MKPRVKSKDVTFSNDVVQMIIPDDENEEEEEEEITTEDDHHKPFLRNGNSINGNNGYSNSTRSSLKSSIPSIGKIRIMNPKNRRKKGRCRWFCWSIVLGLVIFLSLFTYSKKSFLLKQITKLTISYNGEKCTQISSEILWNRTFPMFTIRSSLQLVDANQDSILDTVVSFGTGVDENFYSEIFCTIYFNLTEPTIDGCGGGLMVLDGKSGDVLWKRFTRHELFAPNCNLDITGDGIADCVVGGRLASMYAIDGSNGRVIWSFQDFEEELIDPSANFYRPMFLSRDMDHDSLQDLALVHGGSQFLDVSTQEAKNPAKILIVSSRTGKILTWMRVPDNKESYFHPQPFVHHDGNEFIMFGTGSANSSGSLFIISLDDLFHGNSHSAKAIYSDCCQGITNQVVLADVNDDSMHDIVISISSGSILVLDGSSFEILWKRQFPGSLIQNSLTVGLFNEDQIPDILVVYSTANQTQVTVLNGKNGELLLKPITSLVATRSAALTVSIYGPQDTFLFWLSSWGTPQSNSRLDGELLASKGQIRAKTGSSNYVQLMALSRGNYSVIYDSRKWRNVEISNLRKISNIGQELLYESKIFDNLEYGNSEYFNSPQYQPDSDYFQPSALDYSNNYMRAKRHLRKAHAQSESPHTRFRRSLEPTSFENQRVISVATLAPSERSGCIDIVFAVQWLLARSSNTTLDQMQKCVDDLMKQVNPLDFKQENPDGVDRESYNRLVQRKCAMKLNLTSTSLGSSFLKYPLKSSSIYRKRIKCGNNSAIIRPYNEQIWPSFMGIFGSGLPNMIRTN